MTPRVLFICKEAENYSVTYYGYFRKFSGLFNSARFVSNMLKRVGFASEVKSVVDNNGIDRLVSQYKPDVVFIEALWVVPEKFDILTKLHPNVKWVIRLHSELPFLAMESIAVDWCIRYLVEHKNIIIAPNSPLLVKELEVITASCNVDPSRIVYLPNYYPENEHEPNYKHHLVKTDCQHKRIINVGCFGAIRPFKNQLVQAVAAIEFCDHMNATLHFHINGNRVELGDGNLKNLRNLFKHQKHHQLIEHAWQPHHEFMQLVREMDIGMQVSFTESFNIVTADMVSAGIPVVTSPEISWVHPFFYADPNETSDITRALLRVWKSKKWQLQRINRRRLKNYSIKSKKIWTHYLNQV